VTDNGWILCSTPKQFSFALLPRAGSCPQAFEQRPGCEPTCPVCKMPNALLSQCQGIDTTPRTHVNYRYCRDCGRVFLPDGRQCHGIVLRIPDHPEKGENSGWSMILHFPRYI
jgi:hypothetical protein